MTDGDRLSRIEESVGKVVEAVAGLDAKMDNIHSHYATEAQVEKLGGELRTNLTELGGELRTNLTKISGELQSDFTSLGTDLKWIKRGLWVLIAAAIAVAIKVYIVGGGTLLGASG